MLKTKTTECHWWRAGHLLSSMSRERISERGRCTSQRLVGYETGNCAVNSARCPLVWDRRTRNCVRNDPLWTSLPTTRWMRKLAETHLKGVMVTDPWNVTGLMILWPNRRLQFYPTGHSPGDRPNKCGKFFGCAIFLASSSRAAASCWPPRTLWKRRHPAGSYRVASKSSWVLPLTRSRNERPKALSTGKSTQNWRRLHCRILSESASERGQCCFRHGQSWRSIIKWNWSGKLRFDETSLYDCTTTRGLHLSQDSICLPPGSQVLCCCFARTSLRRGSIWLAQLIVLPSPCSGTSSCTLLVSSRRWKILAQAPRPYPTPAHQRVRDSRRLYFTDGLPLFYLVFLVIAVLPNFPSPFWRSPDQGIGIEPSFTLSYDQINNLHLLDIIITIPLIPEGPASVECSIVGCSKHHCEFLHSCAK